MKVINAKFYREQLLDQIAFFTKQYTSLLLQNGSMEDRLLCIRKLDELNELISNWINEQIGEDYPGNLSTDV